MFSHAECTDSESTEIRSRRIRVYPQAEQRSQLSSWFSASRWFFNKAKEIDTNSTITLKKYELAKLVMEQTPEWANEIPYQIKRSAIFDYWKAKNNAIRKYRNTKQVQNIRFRSRKSPRQSCYIPRLAVSELGVYYTILKQLEAAEAMKTETDSRLVYENGRYYLIVGVKTFQIRESQAEGIVAIDPGVRTFVTFYAGDCCGKLGEQDIQRVYRLCLCMDRLISKRARERNHRKRVNMKRAIWRIRHKIKDLIDELHYKVALFLCSNFKTILLPLFETKRMSAKSKRNINSRTARSMLSLSHYRFKRILQYKAREMGAEVIEVCEAYTSKTCSWNGRTKEIGGAKWIKDENIVVDRDYNGARGIMLRALRDNSLSVA